ncbi:glycosyltransferase family 4 protein [Priestia sp. 40]|uniref:glycosyltransferase family 4 protein n=1 Tax=Priestia TaxID=2800373 RepID=UPI0011BAE894|nr:glycosyltransferase family 4 protein [Priestia megaterium]QDZ81699.1 glycosyltransferase [Priestia megaterium]
MKKVIVIGPIPPPIHGESIALNQIVRSERINNKYKLIVINTNRAVIKKVGKLSFKKIFQDIIVIFKTFFSLITSKKHALYVSISQTKLGLFRDLIIIELGNKFASKTIIHLHGNNLGNVLDSLSLFQLKIAKRILNKVTTGIVLGENLKKNYRGFIRDIQVVPNGIDTNFISENDISKAKLNKNNSQLNIVYLSNLMKEKGYMELIKGVSELIIDGYAINLVLAGAIHNSKDYEEMRVLVKDKNLEKYIKYVGIVTDEKKKNLLLDSDIMILPSNYAVEGQPISIIEGMAAALPIISTKRGCIEDLVKNNGILLKDGTSSLIKEAIINIINNPLNIEMYSKESRRHYLDNFSDEKYINNIIKAID